MSILITKRIVSKLLTSLALAFLFVIAIGCSGSQQAIKITKTAAPQVPKPKLITRPKPEEKAAPVKKEMEPLILENVYFNFDTYYLTTTACEILTRNARALKQRPEIPVVIEGHCDERGTIEYNLALGDRRAKAVKDYLVSLGIAPWRLTTISYGKEQPVDSRHNEEAWAQNRRTQFVIKIQPS